MTSPGVIPKPRRCKPDFLAAEWSRDILTISETVAIIISDDFGFRFPIWHRRIKKQTDTGVCDYSLVKKNFKLNNIRNVTSMLNERKCINMHKTNNRKTLSLPYTYFSIFNLTLCVCKSIFSYFNLSIGLILINFFLPWNILLDRSSMGHFLDKNHKYFHLDVY